MKMPDLDDVLGYYTVKYAHIADMRLGIIQKLLMGLILFKICALTIVYKCNHLLEVPVHGSARANAMQPTLKGCDATDPECISDFTPLSQLSYCKQFDPDKVKPKTTPAPAEEKSPKFDPDKVKPKTTPAPAEEKSPKSEAKAKARRLGETDSRLSGSEADSPAPSEADSPAPSPSPGPSAKEIAKKHCVYWDAPAMTRGRSPVPGTLFLPTTISETEQKRGCKPTEANGYTCDTKPWVRTDPKAESTSFHVADVERFSILLNQAFSSAVKGVAGAGTDFEAFAAGRPDLQDFYTKRKGYVARLEKKEGDALTHIAALHPIPAKADLEGDFKNIYHNVNGDVYEINDILRMADLRGGSMLDLPRDDGTTMRQKGGVVSIDITYSNKKNLDLFGNEPPIYTVSAKFIPMKYYKIQYETLHDEDTRTMSDVNGLLFLINVTGAIRTFDLTNLLTVLTTAMVSLALASTLTDLLMSHAPCLGLKDHYNILKYQPTMDFSDLEDRINTIKEQAKAKGETYHPSKHKSSVCADTINGYADKQENISDDHMLKIICTFEMRLNRLDGMDACNEGDACSNLVQSWRKNFLAQDSFVRAADNG